MSRFYDEDPNDPEAPREIPEYNGLRPGVHVVYENHAWRLPDGSYTTGGMDPPLVIDELILFPTDAATYAAGFYVEAIINDGEWQVNADNLRAVS
jgi:hypothetical protein